MTFAISGGNVRWPGNRSELSVAIVGIGWDCVRVRSDSARRSSIGSEINGWPVDGEI